MEVYLLFLLTILFIFLSIFLESVNLILQIKGKKLTKWFGNRAFTVHAIITLSFWGLSWFFLVLVQFYQHPVFHDILFLKILGIILLIIGGVISSWGYILLGLKRSLCLNFFEDDVSIEEHTLFKYLKNPEDFGLWILLAGFALFTGSVYNLIFFIEYVVLMVPHIFLESVPLKK